MNLVRTRYANTSNRNLMTYVGAKFADKMDSAFNNASYKEKKDILINILGDDIPP